MRMPMADVKFSCSGENAFANQHQLSAVMQARREVSELVSSMVEAGGALPLPEDRLLTIMEAAQVRSPVLNAKSLGFCLFVFSLFVLEGWTSIRTCNSKKLSSM